ncbi:hypothetical protein V5O48_018958 [Marasmius crinis-equi]|uniref:CxC2-like cysteine cluster KDZ transposase-associated domain-containing protein n=1 Tax=Marasmius crinis-equi TaxID=585013 RepID=A0ABR3EJR3_9AGAR
MTMYDFYTAVESRTDGTGLLGSRDRYDEFVRVVRLWRYLKILKRAGIGADSSRDLSSISPGELAIRCPACPRPGFNLPPNWEAIVREDPQKAFLYFKFISVDACFRLKRRAISSEQRDPGLFTGGAYFVEQKEYQQLMEVMKTKPPQEEEGHCLGSGLAAIAQANTKFSKGYSQTGCILCICARHEIVEPNGTVDMNKGERYWHTDYAISSSQKHSDSQLHRVLSSPVDATLKIDIRQIGPMIITFIWANWSDGPYCCSQAFGFIRRIWSVTCCSAHAGPPPQRTTGSPENSAKKRQSDKTFMKR